MAAVTNLGLMFSSWIRLWAAAVRRGALIGLASTVLATIPHTENLYTIHVVVNYLINKPELILYIAMQFCLKRCMKNQGLWCQWWSPSPLSELTSKNKTQFYAFPIVNFLQKLSINGITLIHFFNQWKCWGKYQKLTRQGKMSIWETEKLVLKDPFIILMYNKRNKKSMVTPCKKLLSSAILHLHWILSTLWE